jgi:hypothetical protein
MSVSYQGRVYLHGLVAAILNGVSNSVVVIMVDPTTFNLFQGGFRKLLAVAGASAVFSLFTYLKDHPLPDPEKDADGKAAAQKAISDVVRSATSGDAGVKPTDLKLE